MLLDEIRLNTESHLSLTHHFGKQLGRRGRGGILLVSSTAGMQGVPYSANYSAAKSYVLTLGEAVHHRPGACGSVGVGSSDTMRATRTTSWLALESE